MSDLETTQSKLRSTPTAGVDGEHSAYYRRLLSAGYKGYIQGSIGGATLYGVLGLAVGAAVAIPTFILTGGASAALLLIPAVSGIGVMHGASTFSDIGKTAAIIAESADTNEKRRYLLDRYYETPSDEEAKAIKVLLENQLKPEKPEHMFHWKTVLIGAALGLALTAGFILLMHAAPGIVPFELGHVAELITGQVATTSGSGIAAGSITAILGIGTAIGTLAGGLIGLDREYVRNWMDGAEKAVNDQSRSERQLATREREIQSLSAAVTREMPDKAPATAAANAPPVAAPAAGAALQEAPSPAITAPAPLSAPAAAQSSRPDPLSPHAIAGLADAPKAKVSGAELQNRVVGMSQAMAGPVV